MKLTNCRILNAQGQMNDVRNRIIKILVYLSLCSLCSLWQIFFYCHVLM